MLEIIGRIKAAYWEVMIDVYGPDVPDRFIEKFWKESAAKQAYDTYLENYDGPR